MKNQFEFPLTYDLTSNIFKPKKSKLIYELTALIIHEGRFSFRGHYFSYVKGFNNKWYKCDDEHIAPIEDNEEILTSCPYILFYRMKAISRKSYLNFASCEHKELKPDKRITRLSGSKRKRSELSELDCKGKKLIKTVVKLPFISDSQESSMM